VVSNISIITNGLLVGDSGSIVGWLSFRQSTSVFLSTSSTQWTSQQQSSRCFGFVSRNVIGIVT
jgi:hypothetical protein